MRHLLPILLLLAAACTSQPTQSGDSDNNSDAPRELVLPRRSLKEITSREELDHYIAHYWDDFDFATGERVGEYSHDDICSAFAQYVLVIEPTKADSLLSTLMHRAEASREALDLFANVAHDVLYDPNAPTRNDEYYIPVLRALVASELLDEYDKIIPQTELNMVLQNRLGHRANDFLITLEDESQHRFHSIDADYTILLFNNPGCQMCREIIEGIEASATLRTLRESHNIAIVALYPDEDLAAWRDYLPTMPEGWICGYDHDLMISQNRLYDLKAIPSLYLLDSTKRVLIKDGSSVEQLERVLLTLTTK